MLQIPSTGFALSVDKDNGRIDVQLDWIEGSAVFNTDTISQSDIVDSLIENNSYQKLRTTPEYSEFWVETLFKELDRRLHLLGDAGTLVREGKRIRRVRDWKERPAYAFCLALALLPHYRTAVEAACGKNYGQQGVETFGGANC